MDRFRDGAHVRLRSRVRGAYVCADEDWSSVSLTTRHGTLNVVWEVHRTEDGDTTYVQLFSAAYGRYLALSSCLSPHGHLHGHRGRDAVQRDYRHPEQLNIRWTAIAAEDGSGDVLLCNALNGCYLRANARDGRWKTCSCVTVDGGKSTMMHWTVDYIGRRPAPPPLPTPSSDDVNLRRKIMFVQAFDNGNFSRSGWKTIMFEGRSVYNLMLGIRQEAKISLHITLRARAGPYGRLTPLVMDLPHSEETMCIIVLTWGTPACRALVYPDVPAVRPPAVRPVIELFPDGGFVRIKSGGCFLLADEGGVRVWMSKESICPQQVWVVQHVKKEDPLVLLCGAAYGRYLATEPRFDEPGELVQCAFQDPDQTNLLWRVNGLEGTAEVLLKSANTAAKFTMRCSIEPIPPSLERPNIIPTEAKEPVEHPSSKPPVPVGTERTIWYTVGDSFTTQKWSILVFSGRSLIDLESLLSDKNCSAVLFIRAGPYGKWTPLFTDLPKNKDPIDILVLDGESADALGLLYPRLDAPEA